MTTRLRSSRDYPQGVDVFAVALADPGFHRARLGEGGEVVAHRAAPGRVDVTVRQPIAAGAVPAPIAALLSGALVVTRTEHWTLGAERLDGAVEVVVPRAPVRSAGSMTVSSLPAGGCRLELDVAVRVTVPFAGALVEPAVVGGIRVLTAQEHEHISAYLAGAGPSGAGPSGAGPSGVES